MYVTKVLFFDITNLDCSVTTTTEQPFVVIAVQTERVKGMLLLAVTIIK